MVDSRWPSGTTATFTHTLGSGAMTISPVSFTIPCSRTGGSGETAVTITTQVINMTVRGGRIVGFDATDSVANQLGPGCDNAGASMTAVHTGTVTAPSASIIPAQPGGSTPTPSASGTPSASASPAPSPVAAGPFDRSTPSVLSSLKDVSDVKNTDFRMAGLLTLVFGLLVLIPATLLDNAVATLMDRISAWWARVSKSEGRPSRWWMAAFGVAAAAVISGFVDPRFGLNEGSARTLLSIFVAFVLEVIIGWTIVGLLMKLAVRGSAKEYSFRWMSLLVVAGTVALVRFTGLEPGLVFGLVAGLGFAGLVSRAAEAWSAIIMIGYGAAVGTGAWFAYSTMGPQTDPTMLFVRESLAALALAGIAALPIALLPLAGWEGRPIRDWSRLLWAVVYLAGLFAFFVMVMPMPEALTEIDGPLLTWLYVFAGYFGLGIVAWALTRGGATAEAD